MKAIEIPHTIEAVFWDGTNQEEVDATFTNTRWYKNQVGDDAPTELDILITGHQVMHVPRNRYVCWDSLQTNTTNKGYFVLTKKEFAQHYVIVES
jgi:hypothetical protein